jgi:shikimate dehydrogenase
MRRLGLIGHPVAHSRSPVMQQAALDALGIAAHYELWDTAPEGLAARVAALRQPELLGANVTIPYKAAVVPLLDAIAPQARRTAGVVNTIVRQQAPDAPDGVRLVGHNTDIVALLRVLDEQANWSRQRRALVLGAGGAAQATLGAARLRGAEVWIAARRLEAARAALAALWARERGDGEHDERMPLEASTALPASWQEWTLALDDTARLAAALAATDVLIQATPVGTGDDRASPLPLELIARLPAHAFVFDLVYHPPETALVRAARARGLRAQGGLAMLLHQGAAAFSLWTGREAPLAVMRAALGI